MRQPDIESATALSDECYKKVPLFSISVQQCFAYWRSLGSYPGLEICFSLQVYLEVEPSGSQLVEKAMKAMYGVGGAACANPT